MKTGCTSKISQISEFQNHLPIKSNFHIYFFLSELIQKNQFAMTDPVCLTLWSVNVMIKDGMLQQTRFFKDLQVALLFGQGRQKVVWVISRIFFKVFHVKIWQWISMVINQAFFLRTWPRHSTTYVGMSFTNFFYILFHVCEKSVP